MKGTLEVVSEIEGIGAQCAVPDCGVIAIEDSSSEIAIVPPIPPPVTMEEALFLCTSSYHLAIVSDECYSSLLLHVSVHNPCVAASVGGFCPGDEPGAVFSFYLGIEPAHECRMPFCQAGSQAVIVVVLKGAIGYSQLVVEEGYGIGCLSS